MRKPMVAGNWKMNKTIEEAAVLVSELLPGLLAVPEVEKVLCPPFTSLMFLSAQLEDSDVGLGAQNLVWETSGAYTGEISPQIVREQCEYVIIEHLNRAHILVKPTNGQQETKGSPGGGIDPHRVHW